ncbi:MAG: hypothetical protein PWP76_253 [Candidatus Diapherotrites archaeon]|nr:hypothetical protein [Candidatus Diapherotrites archaeon]MDN5366947.1 hypothetical protein [Candidatus Diapherotrites archaeon]
MQDWLIVTLAAFVYALAMYAFNRVFRLEERNRAILEMSKRLSKDPDSVTEEEIAEHTKNMYKIMGLRLVMLFIVFYPLYYAFSSRYGTIETPLGQWYWLWWFVVSSIVANIVVGGVMKWLALSRGD